MHIIGAATLLSLVTAVSCVPSRWATGTGFWPSFKIGGFDQPVVTYYGYFYLGKDTSTVGCDPKVEGTPKCDTMGSTHWKFWHAGGGTGILDVQIPGGQQLYVDQSGALRYTPPGKPAVPEGVTSNGFRIKYGDDKKLYFSHTKGSFLACPDGPKDVYKIYVSGLIDKKVEKEKKCVAVPGSGNPTGNNGASWYSYLIEPKK